VERGSDITVVAIEYSYSMTLLAPMQSTSATLVASSALASRFIGIQEA
jgi:hypothetical protein